MRESAAGRTGVGRFDSGLGESSFTLLLLGDAAQSEGSLLTFKVLLASPAGVDGVDVNLASEPAGLLIVPASITVLPGQSEVAFVVTSPDVEGSQDFTVTATLGAEQASAGGTVLDLDNLPPIAVDDRYLSLANRTLIVPAANGILKGVGPQNRGADTDPEDKELNAVLADGPQHGTLTLAANGAFEYTPAANYTGSDSFTYRAGDGTNLSNLATVDLTVVDSGGGGSGSGDLVLQFPGGANSIEGTNFVLRVVLALPAGPGGVTITLEAVPSDLISLPPSFLIAEGLLTADIAANGGAVTADQTFTVTATMGGTTASIDGTVLDFDGQRPVANDDQYFVDADTPLHIAAGDGVLAGFGPNHNGADIDPQGTPLTAIPVVVPAHGTLELAADGGFDYTPAAGFTGLDGFSYRASDGTHTSGIAQVVLQVQASPPCFVTGTMIRTTHGDVAVETLCVGDQVVSAFGGSVPVVWIGRRTMRATKRRLPAAMWPIRIRAHALPDGSPMRDLLVSPEHALLFADMLVPARMLVNGTSIRREPVAEVTYWHVELPQHDVLFAEGTPCESYLDTGNRDGFDNAPSVNPGHASEQAEANAIWLSKACAPQCRRGPRLDAIRLAIAILASGSTRAGKSAVTASAAHTLR